MYIQRCTLKIAKWGNSIAVRIPSDVVEKLGISPNEEVEIRVTGENSFEVTRDTRRQRAIENLRNSKFVLPDDYVFNREELHER
jgi:antitoxin MazE